MTEGDPVKPRYTHDCTDCEFTGIAGRYDCYYCHRRDTVKARFGNLPRQYMSGIAVARAEEVRGRDSSLVCALRLARQAGFAK